jgi:hypothetical protein
MDLSWVLLKLDREMSPSLLPPKESVGLSQGLQALRQCREGVGLSIDRWCGIVWSWWYDDPRIVTWLGKGNGVE